MAGTPQFEVAADKYGRDQGGLAATGARLTLSVSSVATGGFIPGDRDDIKTKLWMIRITAQKDVYLSCTDGQHDATSADMLFQAGTEAQKWPPGCNYCSAVTVDPADTGLVQIQFMT